MNSTTVDAMVDDAVNRFERGQSDAAAEICRRILAANPIQPAAAHLLGVIEGQRGNFAEAIRWLKVAVRRQKDNPFLLSHLGEACRGGGNLRDALVHLERARMLAPHEPSVLLNLGVIYAETKRYEEAAACFQKIINGQPRAVPAIMNLAAVYRKMGQTGAAEDCYRRVIALDESHAEAHFSLADILVERQQPDEALPHYRRVVALRAADADAHLGLGNCLQLLGEKTHAVAEFERAAALNPRCAQAWSNAAACLNDLGNLDQAEDYARRAIEIDSSSSHAHAALGAALLNSGRITDAVVSLQASIRLNADAHRAWKSLLTAHLYDRFPQSDIFSWHKRFGEHRIVAATRAVADDAERPRRLRIGYLSSDFFRHPVAFNMLPLLRNRNAAGFEIYAYSLRYDEDDVSREFRDLADCWRRVAGLADAEIAETIRRDHVDILVILAGHFDDNRLWVAQYRAAPVQVSFHDVATSGCTGMDYLIADRTLVPHESEEQFVETVVRLPTYYIHDPIPDAPSIGDPPSLTRGQITFGSFSNPAKLNVEVLDLWATILLTVPQSSLSLKYKGMLANPRIRDRVLGEFCTRGVEAERLTFISANESRYDHLNRYNDIDIALDTFPFPGSTTTFEALWMGVPVVSLTGATMLSRWGASMLTGVGLPHLVASSPQEYVRIASSLAADPGVLSALRATLRAQVAASTLCRAKNRARQIERLYLWMWRRQHQAR